MSFIKKFIEAETVSRRNFLLAGAYGVSGAAAMRMFGPSPAMAMTYSDPTIAWSYRNRTNPYWNEIVSGGEAFVRSLGKTNDDLTHLINEGSSEKSLADVKALLGQDERRTRSGHRHQRRAECPSGGRGMRGSRCLCLDALEQDR